MKKLVLKSLVVAALLFAGSNANAQCRGFAKKQCKPIVESDGYIFNGQLNSAALFSGDKADIMFTFYKGQKYRLVVKGQDILGDMTFKLMDTDKNIIYDSEGKDKDYLDFNVESTQQLVVSIEVPGSMSHTKIEAQGCTAVLIGYK